MTDSDVLRAFCVLCVVVNWANALPSGKDNAQSCMMHQWASSGCTTAGNYIGISNLSSADECCAACAANATSSGCFGWTFHQAGGKYKTSTCDLSTHPRRRAGVKGASCGCRNQDCSGAKPSGTCRPIYRPPPPRRTSLPPGIKQQPNLVSVIVDDLVRKLCGVFVRSSWLYACVTVCTSVQDKQHQHCFSDISGLG